MRSTHNLPVVFEVEDGDEEGDEQGGPEPGPLPLGHHAAGGPVPLPCAAPPHPSTILHTHTHVNYTATRRFIYYRKSVLYLRRKRMFHVGLRDLR